jgi:hypothetical protein
MVSAQNQVDFETYFTGQTLRIDYYHTGDAKEEIFAVDKLYKQGIWAGNHKKCIQPFEMGIYMVKVYDIASNRLIFSKGYNTIFSEYQTIGDALKGIKRTYHESVLVPYPKLPILLVIEKRARNNILSPVFSLTIDPSDYHIISEVFKRKDVEVIPAVNNGNPQQCVDLVILGEGYPANEKDKFKKDLKYYTDLFFSIEPYKSRAKLFNINGVFIASEESGTDEPRQGTYKNTRLGSAFNTFDLDRYCLADDNKSIRDIAASVPYDAILIMVNKDRYGGGGIYNWQTVFNTGSPWRDYVFLHEFGHAFAGLADEYYSKPVAYEDFYTPGVEPLEPNITALLDTAHVKWKQYLSPGIKVPTEWDKATFDSLNNELAKAGEEGRKTMEGLKKKGASADEIATAEKENTARTTNINMKIDIFIARNPMKDKVGVFEGANYLPKGFYRPTIMSLMHKFTGNDKSFGIVNEQAIIATIDYYTGQ